MVVTPPKIEEAPGTEPYIFLAGPIQGAPNWQRTAIKHLRRFAPTYHIASPRVPQFHGDYDRQVAWESFYLRHAAASGGILFWLAAETKHRCDRSFAQTTRFEIGEWLTRSWFDRTVVVVGIEQGFSGARYVRKRIADHFQHVPICSTIRQACAAVVELIEQKPDRDRPLAFDWPRTVIAPDD